MPRFITSAFLIFFVSSFGSLTVWAADPVTVELILPDSGASMIRLENGKLSYQRSFSGALSSKEMLLSQANADKLRSILLNSNPAYSSWKSEDCIQIETWKIWIGQHTTEICRNPAALPVLKDFYSAVLSIMRY